MSHKDLVDLLNKRKMMSEKALEMPPVSVSARNRKTLKRSVKDGDMRDLARQIVVVWRDEHAALDPEKNNIVLWAEELLSKFGLPGSKMSEFIHELERALSWRT